VLKSAVEKGLIGRNPCEGVKLPPTDDDTEDDEDKVFLTEKEFALLRSCMPEVDRDFLTVAVGTGLRWGELTALKVKDLNIDGSPAMLTIRRAWKSNGRGEFALGQHGVAYIGKPKTRESRRRITLAPRVVEALRRVVAGRGPDDLVFSARGGGSPWLRSSLRRCAGQSTVGGQTISFLAPREGVGSIGATGTADGSARSRPRRPKDWRRRRGSTTCGTRTPPG
jgi:integrase